MQSEMQAMRQQITAPVAAPAPEKPAFKVAKVFKEEPKISKWDKYSRAPSVTKSAQSIDFTPAGSAPVERKPAAAQVVTEVISFKAEETPAAKATPKPKPTPAVSEPVVEVPKELKPPSKFVILKFPFSFNPSLKPWFPADARPSTMDEEGGVDKVVAFQDRVEVTVLTSIALDDMVFEIRRLLADKVTYTYYLYFDFLLLFLKYMMFHVNRCRLKFHLLEWS